MSSECKPIDYPSPDGKLSFDILTSVSLTGTNHAENQPVHLQLPKAEGARARHTETNVSGKSIHPCLPLPTLLHENELMVDYAGLLGRACPAAVYEYADAEGSDADAAGKKFVINSQNCIHVRPSSPPCYEKADVQCKTCSIKTPTQDILWAGMSPLMIRVKLMSSSRRRWWTQVQYVYSFLHCDDADLQILHSFMHC
jgi:electron-transferring-flavoprotein dehydrogenase